MKKILLLIFFYLITNITVAQAFWMWTPETGEFINPKYAVKETPVEQLEYALSFYETESYPEALNEFRKLVKHYPKAKEAPDALYYVGLILEAQGNPYGAFKNYQEIIDRYPFSERSPDIVQRQFDIGLAMMEGKDRGGKWLEAFAGNDYNVVDVFKAVIKNAPYGSLASEAQYKIGLYLAEKKLYQEAREEFEKTMNEYPDSEWAKAAKYQIALTDAKRSVGPEYDQKITQEAVEGLKGFVANHPDAELSAQAKKKIIDLRNKEAENNFVVAKYYEKQKKYQSAKIYYQLIIDEYSDTKWVSDALKKIRELNSKITK